MRYLVIKQNGSYKSYQCTNTCNNPKLYVNGSYLPIITSTGNGLQCENKKVGFYSSIYSTYPVYHTRESTYSQRTYTDTVYRSTSYPYYTWEDTWFKEEGGYWETWTYNAMVWTYNNGETGTEHPTTGGHGGGTGGGEFVEATSSSWKKTGHVITETYTHNAETNEWTETRTETEYYTQVSTSRTETVTYQTSYFC